MRPYLVLVPAVLLATITANVTDVHAEPRLGKAWEEPILEGIDRQERELKARRPETVLQQAELLAARRADGATKVARIYLLARAYVKAGDGASAEVTYREVLRLAPDCYFVFHDLAMVKLMTSPPDRGSAEQHLRKAVQIHRGYATAWRKLSRLLLESKRPEEAVQVLRRIVELEPTDLSARYLLADTLMSLKRMDEAEREIAALVRKEPRNPLYRHQKARFYLLSGKAERAMTLFRELAQAHPDTPQPVRGYIQCLTALKDEGKVDAEHWLWALERLYRLTRDPAEKDHLKKAIEDFRRLEEGVAPPVESEGPPTDAQAAKFLDMATEEQRIGLLQWVYGREEQPEKVLFNAIVARLSPTLEPHPKVRQWVLRVLGKRGGAGMTGIVRHSLGDTAPEVRLAAADALMALASTGEAAHGTALLALGQFVQSRDAVLAATARSGVAELAKASLPAAAADTVAARRAAFLTWWRAPGAAEARVAALDGYGQIPDPLPEGLLLGYMEETDVYVAAAAWQQMSAAAERLLARGVFHSERNRAGLDPARHAWLQRLPPPEAGVLKGPRAAAVRAELKAWAAGRPGS